MSVLHNISANKLAHLYSLTINSVILVISILLNFIFAINLKIYWFFLFSFVLYLVSFFSFRYVIYSYINSKLELIYKTIKKRELEIHEKTKKNRYQNDLISQLEDDVVYHANKQEKELEQMTEMINFRKEYIGNIAHELKTPIFNIQGFALTLLEGGLNDETINYKYLKKIEKNINRMINIITNLDALSKLDSNSISLQYKNIDLFALINEVVETHEDIAKNKNIIITINNNTNKNNVYVLADLEYIKQVFSNIIINAIHYNNENGTIVIDCYDIGNNILIEITDTGIGVDEKDLERITERFYRADKSRSLNTGGSGLGLSIVKNILIAHKQTLNIRSKLGLGTTIAFTLSKTISTLKNNTLH